MKAKKFFNMYTVMYKSTFPVLVYNNPIDIPKCIVLGVKNYSWILPSVIIVSSVECKIYMVTADIFRAPRPKLFHSP
jgi:hypothetical protein